MKTLNVTLSSLRPSEYRPYTKKWDKTRYQDLFRLYTGDRNKYRIYLPLTGVKTGKAKAPGVVVQEIERQGYQIEDYRQGLAKKKGKKNLIGIGKLLKNKPDILKLYGEDPQRKGVNTDLADYLVVISRHPYDLASMSTDRGWTSCVDLRSANRYAEIRELLATEAEEGTLVAYLVKKIKDKDHRKNGDFDLNIERPVARVKIYAYRDKVSGKYYLVPAKIYGDASGVPEFLKVVQQFCTKANRKKKINAAVTIDNSRVYLEEGDPTKLILISNKEQALRPSPEQEQNLFHSFKSSAWWENVRIKINGNVRNQVFDAVLNGALVNRVIILLLALTDDQQYSRLLEVYARLDSAQKEDLVDIGVKSKKLVLALLDRFSLQRVLVKTDLNSQEALEKAIRLANGNLAKLHLINRKKSAALSKPMLEECLISNNPALNGLAATDLVSYPRPLAAIFKLASPSALVILIKSLKPLFSLVRPYILTDRKVALAVLRDYAASPAIENSLPSLLAFDDPQVVEETVDLYFNRYLGEDLNQEKAYLRTEKQIRGRVRPKYLIRARAALIFALAGKPNSHGFVLAEIARNKQVALIFAKLLTRYFKSNRAKFDRMINYVEALLNMGGEVRKHVLDHFPFSLWPDVKKPE